MNLTGLFPVLLTSDVAAARAFFERFIGLVPRFESDWYVHLGHPAAPVELGVMAALHDSIPPDARTPSAGVLLSLEVPDAAAEYARLAALGAPIVHELRDEAWGQRHFLLRGPDGSLVDVIERIAPSGEYADAYLGDAS
jgi:catechol 2,3-dioxygenase-like lactoylglutathione lyase family enzyme